MFSNAASKKENVYSINKWVLSLGILNEGKIAVIVASVDTVNEMVIVLLSGFKVKTT